MSTTARAAINPQGPDAASRRLSLDSDVGVFPFMEASTAVELRDAKTAVTAVEGLRRKPSKDIKAEVTRFYAGCAEDKLLVYFKDDITHVSYVEGRKKLLLRSAGLAYAQFEFSSRGHP